MKRRKVDSRLERNLLTGMITSKDFLSRVAGVVEDDLLETDFIRTIAKWCQDYYEEYRDAPGKNIEGIYYGWLEKNPDDATSDAVHDFLEDLSASFDEEPNLNIPYLIDEAERFLNRRKAERLRDELEYSLDKGEVEEASQAIHDFSKIQISQAAGISPLNDEDVWTRTFEDKAKPLIQFPGAAGKFMNDFLTRDALIGIQGPEKRGKTMWCIEFLFRSLRYRKKVALFEVGDMSESQIVMRLGSRLAKRPTRLSGCGDVIIPTKLWWGEQIEGEDRMPEIDADVIDIDRPISRNACWKACKTFLRRCKLPEDETYLKVSIHPNSSINVQGIESQLDVWERQDNFIPDVIIIDYADILAAENEKKDAREQVNDTWKALRRLSQERHCLVISPTQADAASYDAATQGMKNFSEDKRKYAHVTGMLGLNQKEGEKTSQLMRLNWLVLREGDFTQKRCLWVGQCLKLSRALCTSIF